MNCANCQSSRCRRSRRVGLSDSLLAIFGLLVWRCEDCRHRFRARAVPLSLVWYARCPQCENLDLERVPGTRVGGFGAFLVRFFGARACRCELCRRNFPSWRPVLRQASASKALEDER
jgi:hypothetical protein